MTFIVNDTTFHLREKFVCRFVFFTKLRPIVK
jgi:hypothetical protein